MKRYASLLDRLYYTYRHSGKLTLLKNYFSATPDPDRGYAVGLIDGAIDFKFLKRNFIKDLIYARIDPVLFDLSYDYVGDLAETAAHFWKTDSQSVRKPLPLLHDMIEKLSALSKNQALDYFIELLNDANLIERWALLKLGFHNLRIGVSSRFLKQALADYGQKPVHDIEEIWHCLSPPYENLFAWLEGKGEKPASQETVFFHPVMLCQPLTEKALLSIVPEEFAAEWKYDGIRVQLMSTGTKSALYSRTGENISAGFPDISGILPVSIALDGELTIKTEKGLGSYNDLQQRLNRKTPSKKLMQTLPAHLIIYDLLFLAGENLRHYSFEKRRKILEQWFETNAPSYMSLSPLLTFESTNQLSQKRQEILQQKTSVIEGLILKRKTSPYIAGRPAGHWYKWKRDPFLADAVLMYAQRGHGKRSSFYSDYTFGLWKDKALLPAGKAYFGFSDEELKKLDHWIRRHTLKKFGPVREVEKKLVFEVAFEGVAVSSRHKGGFALRFPRIHRIRWDKPASEADSLQCLEKFL